MNVTAVGSVALIPIVVLIEKPVPDALSVAGSTWLVGVNDHDAVAVNPFDVAEFVPSLAMNVSETDPGDAQIVSAQLMFPCAVDPDPHPVVPPEKITLPEFVAAIVTE